MPQIVVRELLKDAWSFTPMLGIVDVPDDNEVRKALRHLSKIINGLNGDGWISYQRPLVQATLGAGVKSLTIGTDPGNDIVTPSTPESLHTIRYSYIGSGDDWLGVRIISDFTANEIPSFADLSTAGPPGYAALYQDDSSVSRIVFNRPADQVYTLQINYDFDIAVVDQNTILTLPSNYEEYLTYELSYRLSADAKDPNPEWRNIANNALARIKAKNSSKINTRYTSNGFSSYCDKTVGGVPYRVPGDMIIGPS